MSKISIGDTIRSYDFEGKRNYYVEGVVMSIGKVNSNYPKTDSYAFKCTKNLRGSHETPSYIGLMFYTPIDAGDFEYIGRIEKII